MNFLAHFYLSQNDTAIITGNFLGDFVKGKKYLDYPENIQKGILIHRLIDSFTDNHSETKAAVKFIRPEFGKYSPVIMDVFFDYCLAVQWKKYSNEDLHAFSNHIYKILSDKSDLFDLKQKNALNRMREYDWLYNYSKKEGIERALAGLSSRAQFENNMANSHKVLFENTDFFIEKFDKVFADVRRGVACYASTNIS